MIARRIARRPRLLDEDPRFRQRRRCARRPVRRARARRPRVYEAQVNVLRPAEEPFVVLLRLDVRRWEDDLVVSQVLCLPVHVALEDDGGLLLLDVSRPLGAHAEPVEPLPGALRVDVLGLFSVVGLDVQEVQRVPDEVVLHVRVERRVAGERRAVVNLDDPRLEGAVDEDVKAQDLEAAERRHRRPPRAAHAALVDVRQRGLHGDDGLVHDVGDAVPEAVRILAALLQVLQEPGQPPLAAAHLLARLVVLHEGVAMLVDGVVREVHRRLLHVLLRRLLVLLRAQPHEPLAVQQDAQRLDGHDERVDAQVELVAVDEQRVLHVLLRDLPDRRVDVLGALREVDALALAAAVRLHDERRHAAPALLPLAADVVAQVVQLVRQHPAPRAEIVLQREEALHAPDGDGEVPLVADAVHAGKVVDLLVGLEPHYALGLHALVRPVHVPRDLVIVVADLPAPVEGGVHHRIILALREVDVDAVLLRRRPPARAAIARHG
mmetsp:Transcript_4055/g.11846  ORF Transcript_4055/g.11846 Transcript_4055/m.11846 type:complete len:493 (+) Transcript_4055:1522-3000(+)